MSASFERFFGQAHVITPILWFGPVLLLALYRLVWVDGPSQLAAFGLFCAGWVVWSLVEYVLHRFIFHTEPRTPEQRLRAFLMHGYHHEYADDKMRLVAPPLMSWPIGLALAAISRSLLGSERWLPFYAGIAIGYLAYDYIHYYSHHFRPKRGLGKWLRAYHMLHHYESRESRFGVSSPLWDVVFGTYLPVRRDEMPARTSRPRSRTASNAEGDGSC